MKYSPEFKNQLKEIAKTISTAKEAYETIKDKFPEYQIPFSTFSVMYYSNRKASKPIMVKAEESPEVTIIPSEKIVAEPIKKIWNSIFTINRYGINQESLADEILAISQMMRSLNCSEIELQLEIKTA